ncbi:MAG: STAS domain-containing protein [Spirochaetota bacterium]|nr:MAG: STAS domain-containing protein [Spirochaetota bacterium]
MNIKVSESDGKLTVKVKGDIYIDQANELLVTFNDIIKKNPKEVILDLKELQSITSSGIGKIVLLYKELQKKNGTVKIIGVNSTIMQIFKIVKLDRLVKIETG